MTVYYEEFWESLARSDLDDEHDREEAIEHDGRTRVERAERERETGKDDVDWGLNA